MKRKQRFGLGILLALASIGVAQARTSAAQVQTQTEASMNVTGELTLTPDGVVTAVKLTDEASLPLAVRERIKQSVASWRFDPLRGDGSALPAQLPMSLLLVAKQGEGENYLVSIRSAHFGGQAQDATSVRTKDMQPPRYPGSGVSGRRHRCGLSNAQDRARWQGRRSDRRAGQPHVAGAGIQTCTGTPGVSRCSVCKGA